MSRSQRHRVVFENYSVTGMGVAEGAIAPAYTLQIAAVPVGPNGGPLQGSSLSGPVPATLPQPRLDHPLAALGVVLAASQRPPPEVDAAAAERTFPIGPFAIAQVDDDEGGILITLTEADDVQVGDTVLVEATGNSSINGHYTVLSVDGPLVLVDNMIATLSAPIEGKGRLTVVDA